MAASRHRHPTSPSDKNKRLQNTFVVVECWPNIRVGSSLSGIRCYQTSRVSGIQVGQTPGMVGISPWGSCRSLTFKRTDLPPCTGLGHLHALSDALLLDCLGLLPAHALANLALSSKGLYAFSTHEDLWKALVLQVGRMSCCDGSAETSEGDSLWLRLHNCPSPSSPHTHRHPLPHRSLRAGLNGPDLGSRPMQSRSVKDPTRRRPEAELGPLHQFKRALNQLRRPGCRNKVARGKRARASSSA